MVVLGGFSEAEIDHQISTVVGSIPPDAEEVGRSLPEVYRVQRDILARVTQSTGGACFALSAVEQVAEYYAQVARELRTIYSLGYYSKDASPLLRSVRVKVRQPGHTVKARQAYLP